MSPRSCLVLFVVAASIFGCGSDDSESKSTGGAGGAAGSDAGTGGAAGGAAGAAAGGTAGSDAAAPVTDNMLFLSSGVFGGTQNTNLLFLSFDADPGQRCHTQKVDGCFVIDCGDSLGALPPGVNAGKVTLANGATVIHTLSPDPDTGTYPSVNTDGAKWATGDTVTLAASGSEVPAFSENLTAPAAVGVGGDAGALTDIDIANDLVVTWSPFNGGVSVTASQVPPNEPVYKSRRFLCEVDGALGTFTVTKKVLAVLVPGQTAVLSIGGSATRDITPGGYAIHLHLINNAEFWLTSVTSSQ
jgi:hypothetical protein